MEIESYFLGEISEPPALTSSYLAKHHDRTSLRPTILNQSQLQLVFECSFPDENIRDELTYLSYLHFGGISLGLPVFVVVVGLPALLETITHTLASAFGVSVLSTPIRRITPSASTPAIFLPTDDGAATAALASLATASPPGLTLLAARPWSPASRQAHLAAMTVLKPSSVISHSLNPYSSSFSESEPALPPAPATTATLRPDAPLATLRPAPAAPPPPDTPLPLALGAVGRAGLLGRAGAARSDVGELLRLCPQEGQEGQGAGQVVKVAAGAARAPSQYSNTKKGRYLAACELLTGVTGVATRADLGRLLMGASGNKNEIEDFIDMANNEGLILSIGVNMYKVSKLH